MEGRPRGWKKEIRWGKGTETMILDP